MGDAIITAIESGLGLMGSVTSEFMQGFGNLFWDSTLNSGAGGLTVVGLFACVFLGISITFAIVKLCLNLIRGNTGMR